MTNNGTKIFIVVMAIIGYAFIFIDGVKTMSASVTITFIFCWTAFLLGSIFAFSPEIKRLVFKKDRLELDRYRKQVDKALVEYDEFKKTIYPLVKMTLSRIAFSNYLGVPARPEDLIEFLNQVNKSSLNFKSDEDLSKLIKAVQVKIIDAFNAQLGIMREQNGLKMDSDKYVSIKYPDFSSNDELSKDDVGIDFNGLERTADEFTNLSEKARYKRKIKQLKKFYEDNFE